MIPWVVVAQAAAAAAEAIYGYIAARNDATERNRKQKQLISAIELTRTSVLSAVNEATVSELQGALQGYEDRYREYDARPQDEQRLVNMIDDSANTLGWLQTNISKTPSRPGATGDPVAENAAVELALKCVTVFIPMVYLRIQMMTEWQITYRAPAVQDIPPLLKRSIAYLVQVRRWLRKESDARFGLIQTRRSSDHQRYGIGFTFEGRFVDCGPAGRSGSADAANRRRDQMMNYEYARFRDGAAPVISSVVTDFTRQRAELMRPIPRRDQHAGTGDTRLASP